MAYMIFIIRQQKKTKKVIFALIGHIGPIKNQIEFINAIKELPQNERKECEFWMIGRIVDKRYYNEVYKCAQNCREIKIFGELTHSRIEELFSDIDVVVCTSVEDMLPINIVEGFMNRKICVISFETGMVDYVINKENAFVYHQGNVNGLRDIISYIINNLDELDMIAEMGRRLYEKSFSTNSFLKRLEQELNINKQK